MTTLYEPGQQHGRKWAMTDADASQLEQLAKLFDLTPVEFDQFFDPLPNSAYGVEERIFFFIDPTADGDRGAAREFWESLDFDSLDDLDDNDRAEFLKGFVSGALDARANVAKGSSA